MVKFIETRVEEIPKYEETATGDIQEAKKPRDSVKYIQPPLNDASRFEEAGPTSPTSPRMIRNQSQASIDNKSNTSSKRAVGTKHIEFNLTTNYKIPTPQDQYEKLRKKQTTIVSPLTPKKTVLSHLVGDNEAVLRQKKVITGYSHYNPSVLQSEILATPPSDEGQEQKMIRRASVASSDNLTVDNATSKFKKGT